MADLTLTATADAEIDGAQPTTARGGNTTLQVGEYKAGANILRSLVKFDLSTVDAGKTIASAVLKVYDDGSDFASNAGTLKVYRVLRNWVEAEVTWNVYSTGNSWATAGCGNTTTDREATEIGSVATSATESAGYVSIDLTPAKVQEWVSGALANYGVLLKQDTESDDEHQYAARQTANPPLLEITYETGGNAVFFGANF